ncbi:MAG: C_GCAxxG_C_C family protein [Clostridia bacterium]|nr:C_GCAxxG_C_C family protein [Clostridia bacterium]
MTAKEKARSYFLEGFNCSQSVFCAFSDRFGIDEETAKKIAAGLGGGVGRMREVCGAVSASAMVLGSVCAPVDGSDKESKMKNYELVREFADRFLERQPSVVCRELLKMRVKMEKTPMPDDRTAEYYKNRPCLKVVEDAAEILEDMLEG